MKKIAYKKKLDGLVTAGTRRGRDRGRRLSLWAQHHYAGQSDSTILLFVNPTLPTCSCLISSLPSQVRVARK